MTKKFSKMTALFLAMCLALGSASFTARASADRLIDGVPYIDGNGDPQRKDGVIRLDEEYFNSGGSRTLSGRGTSGGWYLVSGAIDLTGAKAGTVTVSGDVHMILEGDGVNPACDMAVTGKLGEAGINVVYGNSLTVYAQSPEALEMGMLTVTGGNGTYGEKGIGCGAGIGGGNSQDAGEIVINGGIITSTGGGRAMNTGYGGVGIGGGGSASPNGGEGGVVTINGGAVNAHGGGGGAGIGGGYSFGLNAKLGNIGGSGGSVFINGGEVNAVGGGGLEGGAGIGGGGYYSNTNLK